MESRSGGHDVRFIPNVAAVVVGIALWPVGFYLAIPAGLATGFRLYLTNTANAMGWVVSLL
jgi:hypothetical protein